MRMWMGADPKFMCRQHLLGEHRELHALMVMITANVSLGGFIKKDLIEPSSIWTRHEEIILEMHRRGYRHKTPLYVNRFYFVMAMQREQNNVWWLHKVDVKKSLKELLYRCIACKKLQVKTC